MTDQNLIILNTCFHRQESFYTRISPFFLGLHSTSIKTPIGLGKWLLQKMPVFTIPYVVKFC